MIRAPKLFASQAWRLTLPAQSLPGLHEVGTVLAHNGILGSIPVKYLLWVGKCVYLLVPPGERIFFFLQNDHISSVQCLGSGRPSLLLEMLSLYLQSFLDLHAFLSPN